MRIVHIANDRFEAEILVGKLKDAGIFSDVKFDDQGGVNPGMQFGSGIKIAVIDEDFESALKIISE